jgi:transcriptional regulator with XRE-family HTH domain
MTLAERLKESRIDKGWRKSDLVRAAGISSPSTVTEIESGKRTNSPQLSKLADALGVEAMWLQFGIGPKFVDRCLHIYSEEDIRIAKLLNKLDPELKASFEKILIAATR